jgi:hypothetical protein
VGHAVSGIQERVRLLELLIGLSGATDLGMGLQAGESVRSAALAVGLARRLDLDDEGTREALYSTLLLHLGCTAYAHERSEAFGDEVALNAASARTNLLDPRSMLTDMVGGITRGAGLRERARVTGFMMLRGNRFGLLATTATCEVGRRLAGRLELPDGVQRALYESFEFWNGKGTPAGLQAEEIALTARIARVASSASLFAGIGGRELASEALAERAGGMLDPRLCELFRRHAGALLAELERPIRAGSSSPASPGPTPTERRASWRSWPPSSPTWSISRPRSRTATRAESRRSRRARPSVSGSARRRPGSSSSQGSSTTWDGPRSRHRRGRSPGRSARPSGRRCGCIPTGASAS